MSRKRITDDQVKVAEKALSRAVVKIMSGMVSEKRKDRPLTLFFTHCLTRLDKEVSDKVPTAATDGRTLIVNPVWWMTLNEWERVGVIAHEVYHCVLEHHARSIDLDPERANIAADLAINSLLKAAGFLLPEEGCYAGEKRFRGLPKGKSMEWYYARLPAETGYGGKVNFGEVIPNPGDKGEGDYGTGRDGQWRAIGHEAATIAEEYLKKLNAKDGNKDKDCNGGKGTAGFVRLVKNLVSRPVPFMEMLRRLLREVDMSDYSWFPPDRRFAHAGLYLPQVHKESTGVAIFAGDTSGSITTEESRIYAEIVKTVSETLKRKVIVLHHDTRIKKVDEYDARTGKELEFIGGGGTDHHCVFEWIKKNKPNCKVLVCLTDMCSYFPSKAPDYPVIFGSTGSRDAPFGTLVNISEDN